MRSVAESVGVLDVFPSTNKLQLLTNISFVPVNWSQLTSLTNDSVFQDEFVGLANLRGILNNMVHAHHKIMYMYVLASNTFYSDICKYFIVADNDGEGLVDFVMRLFASTAMAIGLPSTLCVYVFCIYHVAKGIWRLGQHWRVLILRFGTEPHTLCVYFVHVC